SRRRHTRFSRDWSSDVCSSDLELFTRGDQYKNDVYVLPKHLDEKVAALHLDKLGAKLTKLTQRQADYIGVPVEGPFKPEHYRYRSEERRVGKECSAGRAEKQEE